MRDSVSLQEQRRERPLVSPSEILNLPDLAGYLRLGRGLPLAKFEATYVHHPVVAEPFIEMTAALKRSVDGEKHPPAEDRLNKNPASPFLGSLR